MSRILPADQAATLLDKALADYEKVLRLQQPFFATLSAHAKGELLFGLAQGWARKGDPAKARKFFERLVSDAQGSGHEGQAGTWLRTR